jgi:hypothetical protein
MILLVRNTTTKKQKAVIKMKTIKTMVLFFDNLYTSVDAIGEEVLSDWSHKETPVTKYCVIDADLANEEVIPAEYAYMANTLEEAKEEASEWEGEEVVVEGEALEVTELNTFVGSNDLKVMVTEADSKYNAVVLTDCDEDMVDVGGSEMFAEVESIEELNAQLNEAGYNIQVNIKPSIVIETGEDGEPCFEFEGMHIVNPYYDETLRFEVSPMEYYGLTAEQVKLFLYC